MTVPFFLHMHKAGGSSVCKMARLMNHSVSQPPQNWNCNDRRLEAAFLRNCSHGQRYVERAGRTFVAWESPMPSLPLASAVLRCPGFSYGTVLRDPLHRVASWLREAMWVTGVQADGERVRREVELLACSRTSGAPPTINLTLVPPLWQDMLDNGYTRALTALTSDVQCRRLMRCPAVATRLPFGGVRLEHRRSALRLLADHFDIVSPLENLSMAAFAAWGWSLPDVPRANAINTTRKNITADLTADPTYPLSAAAVGCLHELNSHDAALYAVAQRRRVRRPGPYM